MQESLADRFACEYIESLEHGDPLPIDRYLGRLAETQRQDFRELIETATWLRNVLPAPLDSHTLLGGRYRLIQELGAGGFGRVWKAHDEQLGRTVAIKIMSTLSHAEADGELMFDTERRALARIHHSGTVTIHEVGRHEDNLWLAMDLVRGVSAEQAVSRLAARCRDGLSPSAEALYEVIGATTPTGEEDLLTEPNDWNRCVARIVAKVLSTLEAVHAADVLHRDIKPSNVMLRGGGHPVLLDFGVASLRDENRDALTKRLVGTASYFAPEQLERGRAGADPRTDVYQVGLLLYEMLTLRPAFPTERVTDVIERIRQADYPKPRAVAPGIPRELQAICLKAIECDPERRYQSAAGFNRDLRRYLDASEAPHAMRGGIAARVARDLRYGARRHRTAVLVAAAVVLGVLLSLWWIGQPKPLEFSATLLPDGVRTVVQSEQPRYLLAMLKMTVAADQAVYWLPLLPRGEDGTVAPQRIDATHGRVEFDYPEGANPALEATTSASVEFFHFASEDDARAAQVAWQRFASYVRDEAPFEFGVEQSAAEAVIGSVHLAGRGPEGVSPGPVPLLLSEDWHDARSGRATVALR